MTFFATNAGGSNFDVDAVAIDINSTTSAVIDLNANGFVGFIMPAAFTGTAVTFSGSVDNIAFADLYNASNIIFSITVSAARYYCLNPSDFLGMRYVKIVSNATELAERRIAVITRSFT